MEGVVECILKSHGIAFGTGAAIFLITLFLVARRIIGFILSFIFMLIALGASLAIDHQAIVKNYYTKYTHPQEQKEVQPPPSQTQATSKPAAPTEAPEQPAPPPKAAQPSAAPSPSKPSAPPPPQEGKGRVDIQKERIEKFMESHPQP